MHSVAIAPSDVVVPVAPEDAVSPVPDAPVQAPADVVVPDAPDDSVQTPADVCSPKKRKKHDQCSIFDVREVVRYANSLPKGAKAEALCMLKFPNILRSRRLHYWKEAYTKNNYEAIPDDCARSWYQLPNWWKTETGLAKCKGRSPEYLLPTVQ